MMENNLKKNCWFLLFLFISLNSLAVTPIFFKKFGFDEFPTKCNDTIKRKIYTDPYFHYTVKIFLYDCKGKCNFELYDTKGYLTLTGSYVSGKDTLSKYNRAVVEGCEIKDGVYQVFYQKYFDPIESGEWKYYNKQKKVIKVEKYLPIFYPESPCDSP